MNYEYKAQAAARGAQGHTTSPAGSVSRETLSLDARRRTLGLSRELDIPVIEDSAYSALRLDGSDKPSIQALDVEQAGSLDACRVIYLGTF
jgi:DNA-binding transcriptional MocR family regulator